MQRMHTGWFLILVMAATATFAQTDKSTSHTYDGNYQIKAYELTTALEDSFDITDGQMSRFWYAWVNEDLALEKAVLNYEDHFSHGTNASSPSDVTVNFRFAYGTAGVYMLMEVRDDNWVGEEIQPEYQNDAVEFFAETHSAQELYQDQTLMPCIDDLTTPHQLTQSYFQVQVRFGGSQQIDEMSLNWWKPNHAPANCEPGNTGDGLVQYNRDVTFADAEGQYGIKVEILQTSDAWRRQEWLIPWSIWGGPNGGLSGVPATNRVAIAFGYNDYDIGQGDEATSLRWRKADPYSHSEGDNPVSYDAWGDLVFSEGLQTILDNANCTWDDENCIPSPTIRDISGIARNGKNIARTEYFSLSGQKIKTTDGQRIAPKSSLVLKKVTFTDKSSVTVKVPFATVR